MLRRPGAVGRVIGPPALVLLCCVSHYYYPFFKCRRRFVEGKKKRGERFQNLKSRRRRRRTKYNFFFLCRFVVAFCWRFWEWKIQLEINGRDSFLFVEETGKKELEKRKIRTGNGEQNGRRRSISSVCARRLRRPRRWLERRWKVANDKLLLLLLLFLLLLLLRLRLRWEMYRSPTAEGGRRWQQLLLPSNCLGVDLNWSVDDLDVTRKNSVASSANASRLLNEMDTRRTAADASALSPITISRITRSDVSFTASFFSPPEYFHHRVHGPTASDQTRHFIKPI